MDPDEAPTGRTAAFGDGMNGTPGMTASLYAASQRQNAMVPHAFTPLSVLNPVMNSGVGMSATDADRRLIGGGMLPTSNGRSAQTNQASRYITSKYANI